MSVDKPNYTQTPNEIYDLIPQMSEAEMRITFAICRKTFGWHKRADKLSISQLQELTGLSRQGVINGTKAGIERGTICKEQSGDSFLFSIVVNVVDQSTELTSASQPSRPELVNLVDTQKKEIKEINCTPLIADESTDGKTPEATPEQSDDKQPVQNKVEMSAAAQEFFRQWGRKRWKTPGERELFEQTERDVGAAAMMSAVKWGATAQVSRVNAICTAARNKCKPNGNGAGKPVLRIG